MSFGQGMALSYSWKHKIMTKSSTEAELAGVDDSLGYILWARYFMQAQGYEMEASLLYQDNMSAMLLEMNGKASNSKHMKHIKVKFFLLRIRSTKAILSSGTTRLSRCGLISTRSQSRVRYFVSSGDI
jgi:hypothetical protein